MKERPVLFSGPMVRAILAGTKTQTRRVIKPQPKTEYAGSFGNFDAGFGYVFSGEDKWRYCPYGGPGDSLWVRETWAVAECFDAIKPSKLNLTARNVEYRAGPKKIGYLGLVRGKWRPSIHMPKWASRITLDITDVRVERLQGISEEDAIAEGCGNVHATGVGKNGANFDMLWDDSGFAMLWESINGKEYPWESNPWVWAVGFNLTGGVK